MNSLVDKIASQFTRLAPFGDRSEDPLANIKAATRWFDNLPLGNAFKCQQAVVHELKRCNEDSTQVTKDRLAIFMLLDEKSRDLQETLVRQYLRNPRMSRPLESQLWHAVHELYWETARGYHAFLLQLSAETNRARQDGLIPLLTLRALRAMGQLLKWRAIRYLPATENLWLRLHGLYRIAETGGFHRKPQRIYADDGSACNCETAYLHILMLHLANTGSLYPRQLDLLDNWLCGWHGMLKLDDRFDADVHNFVIDLSADHGPRRVRKPDTDKPMRFWSTASLLQKMQKTRIALREGNAPAQLGLTEIARTTESLELLDFLLHHWAALEMREQRRAPRAPVKRLVDVAHGLNAIINQIKTADVPASVSPYGIGLNYNEIVDVQVYGFVTERTRERASQAHAPASPGSPNVERWVMDNESEYGYGAIIESREKDWPRVGALIGIKAHDAEKWKIGIVRRLSRVDENTSSIGIETLAEMPTLAMLYETATPDYTVNGVDNSGNGLPHASLWLDSTPNSMVIDPVHFTPGKVLEVHGIAERKFIALGTPIEHSEGWMRVTAEPVTR
jgi:hypothetical protein